MKNKRHKKTSDKSWNFLRLPEGEPSPVILDIYQSSRGTVLVIENDRDMLRTELSKFWFGQKINGHTVLHVESNCVPVIRKGSHIGLLLSDTITE